MKQTLSFIIISLFCSSGLTLAQPLPPELPWSGLSEKLIRANDDPWVTPAELTNLTETPDYATTISWLKKLADHSPYLTMQTIGKTGQNRDLWLIIAASPAVQTPQELRGNKPTVLFHAGIHSGEIDGKDAGMMFLRDLVLLQPELLNKINILFIPVLSPDGHENSSAYHRVNQRGPKEMGWRTNATNLNLNRDFSKAETPEIQALLQLINRWPIDLYIDIHVTDGIDYQYDVTYGFNSKHTASPNITNWLKQTLTPEVNAALEQAGHIPGPLILAVDNSNPNAGILNWTASPRFSNGYGDVRHLPTILVENHSLKSYKQRVLGTVIFLQSAAKTLVQHHQVLRNAIRKDKAMRPQEIPMVWQWDFANLAPDTIALRGVDYEMYFSPISGREEIRWLGKPRDFKLPYHAQKPKHPVARPAAYWIPAERQDIIAKLELHGVEMEFVDQPTPVDVEQYRLVSSKLADAPFEGRVRLEVEKMKTETGERVYSAGSARVKTDQPLGDLVMLLLEPYGEDSFLQWGYFHEILQRTEYIEGYVIEPLAQKMLSENPELKQEFDRALQDEEFAKNPRARLRWFYERSQYFDPEFLLYPIGREL